MIQKKLLIWLAVSSLVGCTSVDKTERKIEPPTLKLVDQSSSLELFSDVIIGGEDSFFGVSNHTQTHSFSCSEDDYTLMFSVFKKGRESLNTQLTKFQRGPQSLKVSKVQEINRDLSDVELIGPVGLRCSLDQTNRKVRITINSAVRNFDTNSYEFLPKRYVLEASNFE